MMTGRTAPVGPTVVNGTVTGSTATVGFGGGPKTKGNTRGKFTVWGLPPERGSQYARANAWRA